MRLLDRFANYRQENRDISELERLQARLGRFAGATDERRTAICRNALERALPHLPHASNPQIREAAGALLQGILGFDGLFAVTRVNVMRERSTAQLWEATSLARRQLAVFEDRDIAGHIEEVFATLLHNIIPDYLPSLAEDETPSLAAPFFALFQSPALAVEAALGVFLTHPKGKEVFPRLWHQLEGNLLSVSGINPNKESSKPIIPPTKAKDMTATALVSEYLGQTPLADYFETPLPFSIPLSTRFEHTHVLGGSGHGKTQLLQSLILRDIEQLVKGNGSIVVIDSQGDMIKTILNLADLADLSDRLVLIDPNDIENPPCLNLFDFGLDRLTRYSSVEREKLVNGAI